jgi:hypothetical protein
MRPNFHSLTCYIRCYFKLLIWGVTLSSRGLFEAERQREALLVKVGARDVLGRRASSCVEI